MISIPYIHYILQFADNALMNGHRISEWCGHGPVLEQDIALINTALDHIGQARNFYQYAAELTNQLPQEEKLRLFMSNAINQKLASGSDITEDDLAYLRDAWDYRNILLLEQPNVDWAYTVIRSFFYDQFTNLVYAQLIHAKDERLAAIAEKSLKESKYHKKWSSEWVIRLGDGTEESHQRIITALEERWNYSGECFIDSEADRYATTLNQVGLPSVLRAEWNNNVFEIFNEATIDLPDTKVWMHEGGKTGTHSEHLGYILADLQFMQRAYPGMEW